MRSRPMRIIISAASCAFVAGCLADSRADGADSSVPFSVIASGQYPVGGVYENRKVEVIADQSSLDARLAACVQYIQQHTVDFSQRQVVLANMGQRNTGGYSVATSGVQEFDNHIKVKITLTKPGGACAVTQVLTSPFEFVEIHSAKEIVFEERLVAASCD